MAADDHPLFIRASRELTRYSEASDIDAFLRTIADAHLDPITERQIILEVKSRTTMTLDVLRPRLASLRRSASATNGHAYPSWTSQIVVSAEGDPVPIAKNVLAALRGDSSWEGVLAFDEFHQIPVFRRKPPWANGHWPNSIVPFADADENRTLVWVQDQGIHCRIDAVRQALSIVVDDNKFHPIRDYLNELHWDGVKRIDQWLTYYLGVEPIENYTSPVGARWLISAVARVFQPGCTAKYALILEGPQDLGKSEALNILGSPWFTDDVDDLGSKDSKLQVGNAWIVELAELDSMRRSDINTIKAFISRKTDRFRKPFGRYIVEVPRQGVLAGTINPSGAYFHDETGSVRFWPVVCTSIDFEALRRDRDQLFAEALVAYRAGVKWYLDVDEMQSAARDQQDQRSSLDAWSGRVNQWLSENRHREYVTTEQVLVDALGFAIKDCGKAEETRVGIIVRRAGWISRQVRTRIGKEIRKYPPENPS